MSAVVDNSFEHEYLERLLCKAMNKLLSLICLGMGIKLSRIPHSIVDAL